MKKGGGGGALIVYVGTHSQPLLGIHGPLQDFLFFGQIRPGADPGRGQSRLRGVPFFNLSASDL